MKLTLKLTGIYQRKEEKKKKIRRKKYLSLNKKKKIEKNINKNNTKRMKSKIKVKLQKNQNIFLEITKNDQKNTKRTTKMKMKMTLTKTYSRCFSKKRKKIPKCPVLFLVSLMCSCISSPTTLPHVLASLLFPPLSLVISVCLGYVCSPKCVCLYSQFSFRFLASIFIGLDLSVSLSL